MCFILLGLVAFLFRHIFFLTCLIWNENIGERGGLGFSVFWFFWFLVSWSLSNLRFGLFGVLYSKLKLESHKKIMESMGPLEILSKSCRKGGAGSLRSLARDALARISALPWPLFPEIFKQGMKSLLACGGTLESFSLPTRLSKTKKRWLRLQEPKKSQKPKNQNPSPPRSLRSLFRAVATLFDY